MMKLSTMYAVDSAVDTHGENIIAAQILKQWEHDAGSIRFFRSSANFIYLFRKEGKPFFLRFADSSERTRGTIEAEMDILQWVAAREMSVTLPIKSRNGNLVETVVTAMGTFHAVVFKAMEGLQLEIEDLDDHQFEQWGAALGKLHAALEHYGEPDVCARKTWKDSLEFIRVSLPEGKSAVLSEFEQIASSLQALPKTHDNYGLIHSDFELDNLYWHDQTIGIGDFDDCAYGWYIMDIAFALRDLFRSEIDLNNGSFLAFIHGYRRHHELHDELIFQMPLFLKMAKLLTYARLVRTIDIPPSAGYQAWLQSLHLKLTNRLESYKVTLENHL